MAQDEQDVTALDNCVQHTIDPDKVTEARDRLIPREEADRLGALFKLLGDTTRTRILYALLEVGELCVCDIAATIDVPESSVSQALRLLRTAGIVRNRRAGRIVYYSIHDAHVRMLLDLFREHIRHI